MKNFEKLYVHLFTKGIERYRDSKTVLTLIEQLLECDEELLFKRLQDAFEQANRLNLFEEHKVLSSHEDTLKGISIPIRDKDTLKQLENALSKETVSIELLKKITYKQINKKR